MARKGYDDGYNAAKKESLFGILANNPYPPTSNQWDNWRDGYDDYYEQDMYDERRAVQESESMSDYVEL